MKIGLIGLAGAGKDTAALLIQKILTDNGKAYKIDRFAKPLKDAAREVFGATFDDRDVKEVPVKVDQDTMIEASFKALRKCRLTEAEMDKASELFFEHLGFWNYLSPRKYQQLLGTEVGRAARSTVWSDRITKSTANLIVPDVRFDGEVVDYNILITRHPVGVGSVHASEVLATEMQLGLNESYDAMFTNTGTIDELESKLRTHIENLIKQEVI
ncbi:putative dNMP kinase [Acinetobacter phage vB_AbaP_Acibel007]|uniref:Putative dNMP kinase n=1 Tax=Acinetobacter phage vB_AbaP_Acibel007 TaxID=1481187 RepID=A0A075DXM0_9CAUD|nr:putative dNMP kinase [Acinetobacter phage vB_AbaP_Acibel007]AHY26802.1 putative dNMP kinase [Acinetobacter phage vB_AbaP_Acibel007]